MCLEDLRLARGRVVGQVISVADGTAHTPLLPENPNRVALIVTPTSVSQGSQLWVSLDRAITKLIATIIDTPPSTVILRIEDYGAAIMGELSTGGNGLGQSYVITEILSTVESSPLTTLANKDKP